MSTAELQESNHDKLIEQLVAVYTHLPEALQQLIPPTLRELATGQPVQADDITTTRDGGVILMGRHLHGDVDAAIDFRSHSVLLSSAVKWSR